jgi:hypothetical protein
LMRSRPRGISCKIGSFHKVIDKIDPNGSTSRIAAWTDAPADEWDCTPAAPSHRSRYTSRPKRAAATPYGGPKPAREEVLTKFDDAVTGKTGGRRVQERLAMHTSQKIASTSVQLKAVSYFRTPSRTAGVLSKLIARAARSKRMRESERTFESW